MAQARLSLSDAFDQALACHRAGDLGQAERLYRAIQAENPDHDGALHHLGLIAHQTGHNEAALALLDRALATGSLSPERLSDRGIILQALRRHEPALASFERAAALQPHSAEHHFNRGNALYALRRFEAAAAGYAQAVALRPDYAEALSNCGAALNALQRHEAALASAERAVQLRPDLAAAHNNRGNALRGLERFAAALASYQRALALRPDDAEALNNQGLTLYHLHRYEAALECYDKALALRPDFAEAHANRGNPLRALRRYEEALASCARGLDLRPDDAKMLSNRGALLQEIGRLDAALESYARAQAIAPDFAEAHWNEAICRLLQGDFARGWAKHEWRWQTDHFRSLRRSFAAPLWLGNEDLAGKTILLHAEQGFGDTIQFCRYVSPVAARARIVLEVPLPLVRLLRSLPGVSRILAQGETLPPVDFHCPLLSLPLAFATSLATIPGRSPYLAAAPDQVTFWRRRLAPFPGLRVGLAWAGNPRPSQARANAIDRRRSIPLERLAPLAALSGMTFVSLQKGAAAAQKRGSAFASILLDWTEELTDFADTAALVEALDLVITVDTAVVHLAGALGKRVWLLNRFDTCWRWLLDREDSPWYPSLRVFRQATPGDWDAVIARVAAELSRLAPMARGGQAGGASVERAGLDVAPALDRAIACHRAGDLGQAEQAYRAILAAKPDHGDALHLLGLIAHQSGQSETALGLVDRAIAAGAASADVLSNRGHILAALQRPEAALSSFERAAALQPNQAEHHFNRGNMLHLLRRFEAALAAYDRVVALRPDHAEAWSNCGLALLNLGRFEAALESYRRALALRPDFADALGNRGNTLRALRRFEAALASYDAVLAVRPNDVAAQHDRANTLKDLRRFDEALTGYGQVLALRPDLAEAHYNLANTQWALGHFDTALAGYERALALRPDYAEALNNRGNTLRGLKRLPEALASYQQAAQLKPDDGEIRANLAAALLEQGDLTAAVASYDAVLALRPNDAALHYDRATALKDLRRYAEAWAGYDRALALRPDFVEALNNRGIVLEQLTHYEAALASYDQALALRPDRANTHNNRGNVLRGLRRLEEALASYDLALTLRPDYAEALSNRGLALHDMARFDEALAHYAQAQASDPDLAEAHWNEALCRLLRGDLAQGWQKYEWRWQVAEIGPARRDFAQPLWRGDADPAGKTILLHAEQGFGDTIQFCRYAPLAAAKGRIVLEVPGPLVRLLKTLPGEGRIVARGDALPPFDFHCPLLSLPLAFQTRLATIPGTVPYLAADPDQVAFWRQRLADCKGLLVGLVWAGDPRVSQPRATATDRQRSISLDRFAPLAGIPGMTLVSLQKGEAAAQLRHSVLAPAMLDWMAEMKDFADTAALIEALDLVISVDTSVVHLAGALGKPVWLLNRFNTCWRWLLDRFDSPWYPSLRQFRQTVPGDWDAVIARVAAELSSLAAQPRGGKLSDDPPR